MKMQRKMELLRAHVDSISGHTDEDSVVRLAVLDAAAQYVAEARAAVRAQAEAAAKAAVESVSG